MDHFRGILYCLIVIQDVTENGTYGTRRKDQISLIKGKIHIKKIYNNSEFCSNQTFPRSKRIYLPSHRVVGTFTGEEAIRKFHSYLTSIADDRYERRRRGWIKGGKEWKEQKGRIKREPGERPWC